MTTRRAALKAIVAAASFPTAGVSLFGQNERGTTWADATLRFLQRLRSDDGGFAHASDTRPHLTPTLAAIGCYRLLGQPVPNAPQVAEFVRSHWPCWELVSGRFPPSRPESSLHFKHLRNYPAQPKTLGEHIRKKRIDLQMSMTQLAHRLGLGVTDSASEKWEKGLNYPKREYRRILVNFLSFDPEPHRICDTPDM